MAGIYIHIPFCKKACTYCDFHFSTTFEKYRRDLIDCLTIELAQRKDYLPSTALESIYFGGGTPSLLSKEELGLILKTITQHYTISPSAEITLEANPDDITKEKCVLWKNAGINRLSIGVQSFFQKDMDWMNRAHTTKDAVNALTLANEFGFSISLDLIYGLPSSTLDELRFNINEALRFQPDHISAYCLTIEEKTVLASWVNKQKITPANDEQQTEQFTELVHTLKNNGYEQYEISNFAKAKKYAVHNSNYWKGKPYLGVGPSAHSFNTNSRQWNISNNSKYIDAIRNNQNYFELEELSKKDQFNEYLLTGLRTIWGVDLIYLNSIIPLSSSFHKKVNEFVKSQSVIVEGEILKLTEQGKLIADYIASEMFEI